MKFSETNCELRDDGVGHTYAGCTAAGCTWVGPPRSSGASAKRDGVRHHKAD